MSKQLEKGDRNRRPESTVSRECIVITARERALFLWLAGMVSATMGCEPEHTIDDPVPEASLSVEPRDPVLSVGDSVELVATLNLAPLGAYVITPVYDVRDPSIAEVTVEGWLRGVAVGQTRILAYPERDPTVSDSIVVSVQE